MACDFSKSRRQFDTATKGRRSEKDPLKGTKKAGGSFHRPATLSPPDYGALL